jgi:glutathione peroxidase
MQNRFHVVSVAAGLIVITGCSQPSADPQTTTAASPSTRTNQERRDMQSVYALETRSLEGKPVRLSTCEGDVALVVNVASACGYTPQYEGLEKLYQTYRDQGFVVLGFPSNDFGGQEPGSAEQIRSFCTTNYGVTFPMFEKVVVKSGEGQSEIYDLLEAKTGKLPRWNFGKYLVSRDGRMVEFFDTKVEPQSEELRTAIERALAAQ